MRVSLLLAALGLICVPMLSAGPAHAQATRTWVSGVGDDANPCSRTAPCKTFAGAISKTAVGGEIDCLDPGGFGALTITKSITIDCTGTFGSVLDSGTNGINLNGMNIVVVLRGLAIQGAGSGLIGINAINLFALKIERCIIMNHNGGSALGLNFAPTAGGTAFLNIDESYFWSNGFTPTTGGNILIQPSGGTLAVAVINNTKVEFGFGGITADSTNGGVFMTVQNSSVSHNRGGGIASMAGTTTMVQETTVADNSGIGVSSTGGSLVRINNSAIFGNQTGVGGGGTIRSYKNNAINGNGADGTPITQENLN